MHLISLFSPKTELEGEMRSVHICIPLFSLEKGHVGGFELLDPPFGQLSTTAPLSCHGAGWMAAGSSRQVTLQIQTCWSGTDPQLCNLVYRFIHLVMPWKETL